MSAGLTIRTAGPALTVQDTGRPGWLAQGLSRGGAADRLGLAEGAALLRQPVTCAALEMPGTGGSFEATGPLRIALTGAPMRARIGERALAWHAVHRMEAGERLEIGPVTAGSIGYLHLGGGIATPPVMDSRATHVSAGIGRALGAGDHLPAGKDPEPERPPMRLPAPDRFAGGTVRILPGPQTALFAEEVRARFEETAFTRDPRGNRQGMRLEHDGAPFATGRQLGILSDVILPGDIQMTGEGIPYVLMPDCQSVGGYPRIGTVLPDDLGIVAQCPPGAVLRFRFVTLEEGLAAHRPLARLTADLARAAAPLVRDPHTIHDLLSYQLVSGVTAGRELSAEDSR